MSKYKISIHQPCTEDWDTMTLKEQGKHCALCNKVVIDFSKMKNDEIISVLRQNKGKKICGNFYNSQIEYPIYYSGYKKKNNWAAIAAMLVVGVFTLSTNQLNSQQLKGNVVVVNRSHQDRFTEPGKDSLSIYSLYILEKLNRIPVAGASIKIENVGTFTSNKDGMITFSIQETNIPEILHIELFAYGFIREKISIQKTKILKSKKMELLLEKKEEFMLKGDISIEETH